MTSAVPMGVVNVRLPDEIRARVDRVAGKLTDRDLNRVTVSDVMRLCLGRALPTLEAELGISRD